METGSRYDIVLDFDNHFNKRIIMKNIGGDEPFGGDIPGPQIFQLTDRIMTFDVTLPLQGATQANGELDLGAFGPKSNNAVDRICRVALIEGTDEFGRLQPLLGTAEPARDYMRNVIEWPFKYGPIAGLTGPIKGTIGWHSPVTKNPAEGSTEIWEILNVSGDAHPIHLHLVNFEVLDRHWITWDSARTLNNHVLLDPALAEGNRIYLVAQPVLQHNGKLGGGFKIMGFEEGTGVGYADQVVDLGEEYIDKNVPKDVVMALPGQITRIKATFDKPDRYVWHCHILSHEDHEMMRVLQVGPVEPATM